jgi:hypothetical protein
LVAGSPVGILRRGGSAELAEAFDDVEGGAAWQERDAESEEEGFHGGQRMMVQQIFQTMQTAKHSAAEAARIVNT